VSFMDISAKEYVGKKRDSQWENDLARQLRTRPEGEKFDFLNDLLVVQPAVALELARRCLTSNESFEKLLETALRSANPSTMQDWLRCVIPHLGFRHVVKTLSRFQAEFPDGVERAVYWLPLFANTQGFSYDAIDSLRDSRPMRIGRTSVPTRPNKVIAKHRRPPDDSNDHHE
jgi:hypothetical protein